MITLSSLLNSVTSLIICELQAKRGGCAEAVLYVYMERTGGPHTSEFPG
jgi:hypothetical protein